jgi:hypothetical protein
MWGDSWHQKPAPMSLSGRHRTGTTVEIEGDYGGGWGWRVVFDTTNAENLRMRMDNVIPVDQATAEMPAGPYSAMVMDVRRWSRPSCPTGWQVGVGMGRCSPAKGVAASSSR